MQFFSRLFHPFHHSVSRNANKLQKPRLQNVAGRVPVYDHDSGGIRIAVTSQVDVSGHDDAPAAASDPWPSSHDGLPSFSTADVSYELPVPRKVVRTYRVIQHDEVPYLVFFLRRIPMRIDLNPDLSTTFPYLDGQTPPQVNNDYTAIYHGDVYIVRLVAYLSKEHFFGSELPLTMAAFHNTAQITNEMRRGPSRKHAEEDLRRYFQRPNPLDSGQILPPEGHYSTFPQHPIVPNPDSPSECSPCTSGVSPSASHSVSTQDLLRRLIHQYNPQDRDIPRPYPSPSLLVGHTREHLRETQISPLSFVPAQDDSGAVPEPSNLNPKSEVAPCDTLSRDGYANTIPDTDVKLNAGTDLSTNINVNGNGNTSLTTDTDTDAKDAKGDTLSLPSHGPSIGIQGASLPPRPSEPTFQPQGQASNQDLPPMPPGLISFLSNTQAPPGLDHPEYPTPESNLAPELDGRMRGMPVDLSPADFASAYLQNARPYNGNPGNPGHPSASSTPGNVESLAEILAIPTVLESMLSRFEKSPEETGRNMLVSEVSCLCQALRRGLEPFEKTLDGLDTYHQHD